MSVSGGCTAGRLIFFILDNLGNGDLCQEVLEAGWAELFELFSFHSCDWLEQTLFAPPLATRVLYNWASFFARREMHAAILCFDGFLLPVLAVIVMLYAPPPVAHFKQRFVAPAEDGRNYLLNPAFRGLAVAKGLGLAYDAGLHCLCSFSFDRMSHCLLQMESWRKGLVSSSNIAGWR